MFSVSNSEPMKKIKLFSAADITTLQAQINDWLAMHKDAHILESSITSLAAPAGALTDAAQKGEYAFYFLYTPATEREEESVIAATKQLPEELTQAINNITEAN